MADKPRVLACILCGPERHHWINPRLVATLLRMQADSRFIFDCEFIYGVHGVDAGRNLAIEKARATNAAWCIQFDNDMTCNDPLGILSEADALHLDVVSVSAGISKSEGHYQPNVDLANERRGNFMRVSNAGAGVLMINSRVWNRLSGAPLFVFTSACGEDVYFCQLVQGAGFGVWTHASLAGHLKTVDVTSLLKGI